MSKLLLLRKSIVAMILVLLLFPLNVLASQEVKQDIERTAAHLIETEHYTDWSIAALAKANHLPDDVSELYRGYLVEDLDQVLRGTSLQRMVIAVAAIGEDPTDFEGVNLIEKVYSDEFINMLSAQIYGLIALNTGEYDIPEDALWTEEKLLNKILEQSLPHGGWGWDGVNADLDFTGMALTALGFYKDRDEVQAEIDKAVTLLADVMQEDGGFDNWGVNSNTAAQVIIGLSSVGVDVTQEPFYNDGHHPLQHLLDYQLENGAYKWLLSDTSENSMSTEQAFQALVAYNNLGVSHLYDFSYVEPEVEPEPIEETPGDQVEDPNDEETQEPVDSPGDVDTEEQEELIEEEEKKEKLKEDQEVDNEQVVVTDGESNGNENNNQAEHQSSNETETTSQEGERLPDTATSNYHVLALGALFFLIGTVIFFTQRRKVLN
ncbi:LPXTG-motif cell wall anchor domain-containing protein [Evansella cellulosilytica]|uniref:LPXTG-motif cell wall anchor domain protein n=1 Tax=Evansella cellulosilytica (strain ATCC 21833 / DSM 2522 / FERM P-1141 / JCM 9156 / N-4) TaxID=649639 RepID=E6TX23_EVAC2|nr:LPXTG-motif cell wall anchor domain-containing protein [Evansella cellulosilytica]ADU31112.1 LPXTG-motif cell wall anchor domain protein [Evansella cellulosilytica DSM 2522]